VVEGREFGGGEQRQRWFGDYVEFSCLGQEHGVGGLGCGVSREGIEAFFSCFLRGARLDVDDGDMGQSRANSP
jgi:hypothetical protein